MNELAAADMLAKAIDNAVNTLGLKNADTEMGAIELLAKEVKGVAEAIYELANAVRSK